MEVHPFFTEPVFCLAPEQRGNCRSGLLGSSLIQRDETTDSASEIEIEPIILSTFQQLDDGMNSTNSDKATSSDGAGQSESTLESKLLLVTVQLVEALSEELLIRLLQSDCCPVKILTGDTKQMIDFRLQLFSGKNFVAELVFARQGVRTPPLSGPDCVVHVIQGSMTCKVIVVRDSENPKEHFQFAKFDSEKEQLSSPRTVTGQRLSVATKFDLENGRKCHFSSGDGSTASAHSFKFNRNTIFLSVRHRQPMGRMAFRWSKWVYQGGTPTFSPASKEEESKLRKEMLDVFLSTRIHSKLGDVFRDAFKYRLQQLDQACGRRENRMLMAEDAHHVRMMAESLCQMVAAGTLLHPEFKMDIVFNDDVPFLYRYHFPRAGSNEGDFPQLHNIIVRLHLFPNASETYIHNHRGNFITACLAGEYSHSIWQIDAGSGQHTKWRRNSGGQLSSLGTAVGSLRRASTFPHVPGNTYYLRCTTFHTVSCSESSPWTLTLMVKDRVNGAQTEVLQQVDMTNEHVKRQRTENGVANLPEERYPEVVQSSQEKAMTTSEREKYIEVIQNCLRQYTV